MSEAFTKKPRKNKFLITFVCIFTSALLAFGGVFGIIRLVKERSSVAKYDGIYLDEGAARYLASYYKRQYKDFLVGEGIVAYDSYLFWEEKAEDGKTYGEHLAEGFGEYLASILAAVRIYEEVGSYTREEKEYVKSRAEGVLNSSSAEGSVEKYNELAEPFGFDYDDFLSASEYLYKASVAKALLYGADGSGISSDLSACEKYLETYSRVALMFISLDRVYIKDQSGNFTYDDDGNAKWRELTPSEREEREETVEKLRGYISSGEMTTEAFEYYLAKSDVPDEMDEQGYYFNPSAETTAEFAEKFSEVVDASYEMKIGEYKEAEAPEIGGVCFIYKYAPESYAYLDTENVFFSDFYMDASTYTYLSVISELSQEVTFTDGFYEMDIVNESKIIATEFIVGSW